MTISEMTQVVYAAKDEIARLRTVNAELLAALKCGLDTLGAVPPNPTRAAVMLMMQSAIQKAGTP